MKNSYPVKIKLIDKEYSTKMYVDAGSFEIKIKNCLLETPGLYQHWEINEESYNTNGNKLNFELTGYDLEITNFDLLINTQLVFVDNEEECPIDVSININYSNYDQVVTVEMNDGEVFSDKDLENTFIKLNSKLESNGSSLKSCSSCLLSGYEKGGCTMWCFKEEKDKLLKNTKHNNYQNWYYDLERHSTYEFNVCDKYIPERSTTKPKPH